MTDSRLRDLERKWKESGAVEDEVAWLREAVRRSARPTWSQYARLAVTSPEAAAAFLVSSVADGGVDRAELVLAARCGHPPAAMATGARAVSERGKRLPPLSAFGRRGQHVEGPARSGVGMR